MNELGKKRVPFLFIIDFEMNNPIILPMSAIDSETVMFDINGITNCNFSKQSGQPVYFQKQPVSYNTYRKSFLKVREHFFQGNTYLLNLTFPTEIKSNLSLKEIYSNSFAKYRLYYKDKFIVFSPETFIKINNGKIFSYPMKGTIDASIPDAYNKILKDDKEMAEHITIVDLIRNDLNMVSRNVNVLRFRYVEKISTNSKDLYQVSSEIMGELDNNYNEIIGNIIFFLLPAGSISGAPKIKTIEIIKEVENYKRGYYTGVFGYFDGHQLDSGVMIRFIEKEQNKLIYKSGGGLTIYSDLNSEYQEMVDKVYVPINRDN